MEMRSVLRGVALFSLMQASCLAYSQSSVTLYGIIDTGVEYYNHAAGGGSFAGMPTLTGEVPSEWGLTGVEDLGGGTKAFFKLENGFAPGTGGYVLSVVNGVPGWVATSRRHRRPSRPGWPNARRRSPPTWTGTWPRCWPGCTGWKPPR